MIEKFQNRLLLTDGKKLGKSPPVTMLNFFAFTVLSTLILGCVWWVSRDDQGAS